MTPRARRVGKAQLSTLLAAALALLVLPAQAAPEARRYSQWGAENALTTAPGRWEFGLLSDARLGVNRHLELRAHPVGFLLWPHLEAKVRLISAGAWQLSSVHRISYPSLWLNWVAHEGTLGLLPETYEAPQAVLLMTGVIGSVELARLQWLSVGVDAQVAPRSSSPEVVLDFPFLYQRLGALHADLIPRATASLTGSLGPLDYAANARHTRLLFPQELTRHSNPSATDYSAKLYLRTGVHHRFGLEAHISVADLPVGTRTHWLPLANYQYTP